MKKLNFFWVLLLCALISCNEGFQNKDIETVKSAQSDFGLGSSVVNGDLIKQIVGIKGTMKWESFKPAGYEDNPNIVCVQVDITRNKEKNNLITMQYLLNRETGVVKTTFLSVDGKTKSRMDFYFLLMEIGIDNL
jgi:hypothetical protein